MLSAAQQAMILAAYRQTVDNLGVPAVHTQAKLPNTVTNIATVGFSSPSGARQGEVPVVNSYDVADKVVTVRLSDLPAPPERGDRFTIAGEVYHATFVKPLLVPGGVIFGWRVLVRGK